MSPRAGLDAETLVAAAADIVDQEGWDALTLASLAQKLGVRSPSLYNHVNGLTELRSKLALYSLESFNGELAAAVKDAAGDDAVYALSEAYLRFAGNHPGLYEATLKDQSDPDIQEAASKPVDLIVGILQPYGLDDTEAIHIVRGLRSLLHGFASIQSKGGFGIPLDVRESLRLSLGAFMAGVKQLSVRRGPASE
ncbi:TetR/AcrR family transcriptional regulator [Paenibacillus thailandensis]|jgi:AcrR family transcriptional regulator|uniref:TetR/AcrR family transcriptional regulator n=1 Tax=Paenibacillus thailandensis TaxID=393250 RepID=A0ABW5QS57_9BACL